MAWARRCVRRRALFCLSYGVEFLDGDNFFLGNCAVLRFGSCRLALIMTELEIAALEIDGMSLSNTARSN